MKYAGVISRSIRSLVFLQVLLGATCGEAANYTFQYSESASYVAQTGWRADVSGITPLSYSGTVTVPGSYSKNNCTYIVVGINSSAFNGSSITKLYISANCSYINRLGTCTDLKKIVIRRSSFSTYVANNAFTGTHADCIVYVPSNFKWRSVLDTSASSITPNEGDSVGGRRIEYFHYHVAYNANGGTGSMATQKIYTDASTALSACSFSRPGYSFDGWATSATGSKTYSDKQKVTNLSTGINDTVTLYAVWKALPSFPSGSITATSYSGKYDGSAHKISVSVGGGISGATIKYASSENGSYSTTCPTLTDAGTITTWYEVSKSGYASKKGSATVTISKRNVTLTSESASKTYDGTALVKHEVVVSGDGFVSGQGASYSYSGTQTAAGSSPNAFTYSLNANTKAGNYSIATVNGTLTVNVANISNWNDDTKWSVTLNGDGEKYDGKVKTCTVTSLSYDGIAIATFDVAGNTATDVGNYMLTVTGTGNFSGMHNIPWSVAEGDIPFIDGDNGMTVTGDYTEGYVLTPSDEQENVEVVIPEWMPPSKVTVKVATTVETVKSNGAEIRVVRGSDDITEFLSIPEAENGVVNLAVAEVKPEIVKEAMDAENGAVIDVSGDEPSIKTAATKPGLVYTLWEGESLESMKASTEIGASKIGDGEPFEPTIKINRSNSDSGFYAIEVSK